MKQSRPLVILDTETTGTDPLTARVVQLAAVTLHPDGRRTEWQTMVNPGMHIPPGASAVHRIYDVDVIGAPSFAALAPEIAERLTGCDIGGHNARAYDLLVLEAEFARCGRTIPWAGAAIVDTLEAHRHAHPGTLAGLVRAHLGRDHADAHDALADARATADVLLAMQLDGTPAEIDERIRPEWVRRAVDPTGKLIRNDDGEIALAFGQHRGRTLRELARAEPGYLRWMRDPARGWHPAVVAALRGV